MAMHSFCLYGHNTTQYICLGDGPSAMEGWSLDRFPGPTLLTDWLGVPPRKWLLLPPDLLQLLYDRFRQANPAGVSVARLNELEERFAPEMPHEECTRLFDERTMFVGITLTDRDKGYPHLRPYLPEVFDMEVLLCLADDPWLDAALLAKVGPGLPPDGEITEGQTADGRRIISSQGRSERWWPQWRAYCDALSHLPPEG
jgi:hypothetical protein